VEIALWTTKSLLSATPQPSKEMMKRTAPLMLKRNAREPRGGKDVTSSARTKMRSYRRTREETGPTEGAALLLRRKVARLLAEQRPFGQSRTHGALSGVKTVSCASKLVKASVLLASIVGWNGSM